MSVKDIHKKYKLKLNHKELEVVMEILQWYLGSRTPDTLHELSLCRMAINLGIALNNKHIRLITSTQTHCTINLNVIEASALYSVLTLLPTEALGTYERSVICKIYEVLKV